MSIATEIQRLQTAKADLKTAIKAKGVEVADTDTIDTYASKIDEIQTGGNDSWYDTFWDNYQDYGNRTLYGQPNYNDGGFSGDQWSDEIFNPKYDIRPTQAYAMFSRSSITDLTNLDINLDFSQCTDARQLFANSKAKYLGILDLSKQAYQYGNLFFGCKELISIIKLILAKAKYSSHFHQMFQNCNSLTDINVEGVINQTISFSYSPLTAESAKSIISCLENFTGTENEFLYSISFSETTWSYLDAEGDTASPFGTSWRDYIQLLGWNI